MVASSTLQQLPVTRLLLRKALSRLNSNRVTVSNNIFIKDIASRRNNIDKLNTYMTKYIKNLKTDYINVIEKFYNNISGETI